MSVGVISALRAGDLVLVEGGNFSGRTAFLRTITGLDQNGASTVGSLPAVYIGPEIYNAVSGIAPTVQSELAIHSGDTAIIEALAEEVGLAPLLERNPVTLSGGEQAALVTISGFALRPRLLALDCALEQIEPIKKRTLCSAASSLARASTVTLVADNRMAEWPGTVDRKIDPPHARSADLITVGPVLSELDFVARREPFALRLCSVRFQYPGTVDYVIRDASAVLEPGHIYHLRGANGCGKTTLAKLICGVLRPTAGQILAGPAQVGTWPRPGGLVAYHFQNPDVQLFEATVDQEISVGASNKRSAMGAITAFGLAGVLSSHPLDLPFVLRKRVALAASVAMGRPWLILDEPTLGQDDATARAIAKMITTLAEKGIGVIVISHSRWFADLLDAQPLALHEGTISGK
jgi:energy-coupling factor transport system ATP-binding protein